VKADQLSRKMGKRIELPIRKAVLKENVLALDVAMLA
jgi:hypothetical protein